MYNQIKAVSVETFVATAMSAVTWFRRWNTEVSQKIYVCGDASEYEFGVFCFLIQLLWHIEIHLFALNMQCYSWSFLFVRLFSLVQLLLLRQHMLSDFESSLFSERNGSVMIQNWQWTMNCTVLYGKTNLLQTRQFRTMQFGCISTQSSSGKQASQTFLSALLVPSQSCRMKSTVLWVL